MKIVAFNGSPKGPGSNTDYILQPFMAGAREAGAEAEVVYLYDKKIKHCTGCFTCWIKTPGICIHTDDMPDLVKKIRAADVIVYATPLYVFSVSGLMKDFMDRSSVVLAKPDIIKRGNQYIHPMRHESEWPKRIVLISNAGYPERHHFDGLLETFRTLTRSAPDFILSATILCPAGPLLAQERFKWYLDAARTAGREIAEHGRIMQKTQDLLDQNLVEPDQYARMVTDHFQESADAYQKSSS